MPGSAPVSCCFSQPPCEREGRFVEEAPEMERNEAACPKSLADEWLRPEPAPSPQPVSFQPRRLLLCCAWSPPGLQPVWARGPPPRTWLPPSLSLCSFPELCTGTAKQLPPPPSTLEGNMLFLDDKPQGATNSYCRHMWVAQDSGTCPCPCASPSWGICQARAYRSRAGFTPRTSPQWEPSLLDHLWVK